MKKSIYRKAAESINAGIRRINGFDCAIGNTVSCRIFSCWTIDAISMELFSDERNIYESFMCYNGRSKAFESDHEAIIALLLFDEIVKHGDHKD